MVCMFKVAILAAGLGPVAILCAPLWPSIATTMNISAFHQFLGDVKSLCRPLVYRSVTDSTMDLAARELREGAAHGTIVLAEEQTAGRGRAGGTWRSPNHANLYFTILLLSGGDSSQNQARSMQIHFAVASAVARAIKIVEPQLNPRIRWPLTVELDGSKVSGSLIESHLVEQVGDNKEHFAVGIGINVNSDLCTNSSFSQDVTSLRCSVRRLVDRERLLAEVCRGLEMYLTEYQFPAIKREYLSLASDTVAVGVDVSILNKVDKKHMADGKVTGIKPTLSLLVRAANGSTLELSPNGIAVVFPKGRRYRSEL